MTRKTPLGVAVRGMLASAVGTLAMDLLWFRRAQRRGTWRSFVQWETADGLDSWEKAPVPAQVGRRMLEGVAQTELDPKKWARPLTNVVHWTYAMAWGAAYGIVAGSRRPKISSGPAFGAFVWGLSYVTLPPTGLYKQIWQYDAQTLWKDASAHLVFGTGTGLAFRALMLV
jgi:hypothetical protein